MTSIAFLLGVVPLMIASGAGAAARNSLGTAVFGGMLVSTAVNLIFTPSLYVLVRRLTGTRHVHAGHGEAATQMSVPKTYGPLKAEFLRTFPPLG
jgi:HAE1 family hydrophobic/amphiphilic exporter-1